MTVYTGELLAPETTLYGAMTPSAGTTFTVPNDTVYGAVAKPPGTTLLISPATLYAAVTLGGSGSARTYVMRGRYVAGSVYEYWTAASPTTAPPSGHSLSDTTVLATY